MTSEPKTLKQMSHTEFTALLGMLFATIAFSIDAMLPALPQIVEDLGLTRVTLAQWVLVSFVIGLGLGTFIVGPISDRFGRKPVILIGGALYMAGALLAYIAPDLKTMVAARILQGFGAAGPRVVGLAMVRDMYSGRIMAQVVSFAMLVFTLFPAVAPLMGAAIIAGFGWRAIFLSFLVFSAVSIAWLMLRQPETLPPERRVQLRWSQVRAGLIEALSHRQMQLSILTQTLIYGVLFGMITSIQQVYDITYGRAESFPYFFALIALAAAPAAPLNGWLVTRLGMRPLIRRALIAQACLASGTAAILASGVFGAAEFWAYLLWSMTVFAMLGFTIGNLNALALEPLGHIAGLATSVMGGLSTVAGGLLGAGVGQLFNGTALPLAIACAVLSLIGALVMRYMPREIPAASP